jgi:hypothetical protein
MLLILYKNKLKKNEVNLAKLKSGGIVLKGDETDASNKLMSQDHFYDLLNKYVKSIDKKPIFLRSKSKTQYIKINKSERSYSTKVIIELFISNMIKLHFSIFLNKDSNSNYPHITFNTSNTEQYHIYLTKITVEDMRNILQGNQHNLIIKLLELTLQELNNKDIQESVVISSYIFDLNMYIKTMKDILVFNNKIIDRTIINSINRIKLTSYLRSKTDLKKEKEREEEEKKSVNENKIEYIKQLALKYSSFITSMNTDIDNHFSKKRQIETFIQQYNDLFDKKPGNFDIFLSNYMKEISEKDISEILEYYDFIFNFNENVWIIYVKDSKQSLNNFNLKEYLSKEYLFKEDLPIKLRDKIIFFNKKILELIDNKSIEKTKQFESLPISISTITSTKKILKLSTELDAKLQTLSSDIDNLKSNKRTLDMKYDIYKRIFQKSFSDNLNKLFNKCVEYKKTVEKDEQIEIQKEIQIRYEKLFKTISDIIFDSKFIKRLRFLIKKELNIDLGNVKDNLSDSKSSISSIK